MFCAAIKFIKQKTRHLGRVNEWLMQVVYCGKFATIFFQSHLWKKIFR